MKAAVLTDINYHLKLMDVFNNELKPGQVLVGIKCAGICGAQLNEISGAKGPDLFLPHMLGHEGGGIVTEIGPGVRHVQVGDHVVMHWRQGVGIDAGPSIYTSGVDIVVGSGPIATFAEQAVVSENRVTKIDTDIPFDVAAMLGCAVTTGLGLINNEAQLKFGQSIAIAGVGGVGLNIIQGAALASAGRIIAIDLIEKKLVQATRFGATVTIRNQGGFVNAINRHGGLVDVFVDCTGIPDIINEGLGSVKPGGKLILVGQTRFGLDLKLTNMALHYNGKTIIDSQGGLTNPTTDIPRYITLYRRKKLNIDGLITHRYPLEDINEAIKQVRSGNTGRCVLEMN